MCCNLLYKLFTVFIALPSSFPLLTILKLSLKQETEKWQLTTNLYLNPKNPGGGGGGKGGGGGGKGGGGGGGMMAPPMMGSPMCTPMMGGGYPGIGGMGPNLVFNFNQPYGYMMAAVAQGGGGGGDDGKEEEAEEEEKPKPEYVQADPTWRNPRMVQEKGKPLKKDPCVIQ
ncbi:hypothetical protein FB192DRAFT_1352768 [Mucor lusitanicus]|uniref:Uncharacterized protein n=1 Tax=Mucor circinelloides f. lusitanicus TaxID=29924 RepID=A0A8H4BSP7_MUCCL|nr:hypothetical protein FB192DRAFT_1352768 [Mucor lusitanicus]